MPNLIKKKNHFQIICAKKSIKEIKADDGTTIGVEIEGYASTSDKDRVNDIVEPTAFKNALEMYMTNPIVLLQHNANSPVGVVTEAHIDEKGLYIKAKITEDVNGALSAVKNGVIRTFSIGYKVTDYEDKEVKNGEGVTVGYETVIKDLELFEISLVSIPANPYALVKSLDSCFVKSEVIEETPVETVEENAETEEVKEVEEVIAEEVDNGSEEEENTTEVIEEEEKEEEKEKETEEDEEGGVEVKGLSSEDDLNVKFNELLKEKYNIQDGSREYVYICGIFDEDIVYNHFGPDFDKYLRIRYKKDGTEIMLDGEATEVEATREWVDVVKGYKEGLEVKGEEEVEVKEEVEIEAPKETEEVADDIDEVDTTVSEVKEIEAVKETEIETPEEVEGAQDSENAEEVAADDVEKDEVEEGKTLQNMAIKNIENLVSKSVKAGNTEIVDMVKTMFTEKDQQIEAITKKLDNALEVITVLGETLMELDSSISSTVKNSGYAFETLKPKAKKKTPYGTVISKCLSTL